MRNNIHSKGKRQRVIALLLFMFMSLAVKAQVFMMDGDDNYRDPEDPAVFAGLPEDYALGVDWYTPISDGMLLLTALGGAYLLKKNRKNKISN